MAAFPQGIKFPFQFGSTGGVLEAEGVKKVSANLSGLVATPLKSRVIRKDVGTISYAQVLRNRITGTDSLVEELVREPITKFEPRALVRDVTIRDVEDDSGTSRFIDVSFVFRETGEADTSSTQIE